MRNKQRTIKKNTVPIIYGNDGKSRKCNFKLILTVIFVATVIMILLQSKGYIKFVGRNTRYHHIPTTTLQELEKYSGYYPTNEEITKINTEIFNS